MRRLVEAEPGREQNELARDAYGVLHFPIVAGIVLAALGLKTTLAHVGDPLDPFPPRRSSAVSPCTSWATSLSGGGSCTR